VAGKSYLVVRFDRNGDKIGPRQAFMFEGALQARLSAQHLARTSSGVAIVERIFDPETGDDDETLIARIGAIPTRFPDSADWSMRLN
jgi:hypothetical protein